MSLTLDLSTRNSDAKAIATCPASWFLGRVMYPEATSPAMERGTAIHADIESAIRNGRDHPVKHHPVFADYDWTTARVEVPFQRQHPDLKYPIWGTADLLIEAKADSSVLLVDWKSGRSKADGAQLDLYRFGMELQDARAIFFYLDKPRATVAEVPYAGDARVIRRIRATEDTKQMIIANQRATAKPGGWCRTCPVRPYCPARGPKEARTEALRRLRGALRGLQPIERLEKTKWTH